MNAPETILDQIREMAHVAFGIPLKDIEADTTFVDLGADDLDRVNFEIEADETYGLASATDDDFDAAKTVGEFAALVEKHKTRVLE